MEVGRVGRASFSHVFRPPSADVCNGMATLRDEMSFRHWHVSRIKRFRELGTCSTTKTDNVDWLWPYIHVTKVLKASVLVCVCVCVWGGGGGVCVCVCARVCVRLSFCMCLCAGLRVCVCMRACRAIRAVA